MRRDKEKEHKGRKMPTFCNAELQVMSGRLDSAGKERKMEPLQRMGGLQNNFTAP